MSKYSIYAAAETKWAQMNAKDMELWAGFRTKAMSSECQPLFGVFPARYPFQFRSLKYVGIWLEYARGMCIYTLWFYIQYKISI